VPKVQHKPIKVQERVQIKRAKDNPKAALVWRTGLSGVPAEQRVLHANGRLQRNSESEQCAPARAEVKAAPEGTPDSE
jgi:hypothetical protein